MEIKKMRVKTIVAVSAFLAVFSAMLAVVTVYEGKFDLEVSKILTSGSLPSGAYFSTSEFGLFFEAVGSMPIFLFIAVAGAILFRYAPDSKVKALKIILAIVGAVMAFVGFFLFVKDCFGYIGEASGVKYSFIKAHTYVTVVEGLIAAMLGGLLLLAWRNVAAETNKALIKWAIVIIGVLAAYLIVNFVKGPVGRIRYRAMNYLGAGFGDFTPWYKMNGARNPVTEVLFYDGNTAVKISDSAKSFPSGHTYSAAMIYTITCLPHLIPSWKEKKWVSPVLYAAAVLFTGLVAVSRIVVGAHYFSDVLFGGTISFIVMIILREIFVCKLAHVRCFKKQV